MFSNSTYFLLPIAVISLLLYLSCNLLVRLGVIGESTHRKIWNTVLLVTFLPTAILGLILAIQVNYKLEWDIVKSILKWHVDFGIGMSFVAIFHIIWHWRYYFNLNKKQSILEDNINEFPAISRKSFNYLILLLGFIGTVVQVLLIRQITAVLEGNELMMAWTLGAWMVLTGVGAYLGRRRRLASLKEHQLLASIFFILGVLPLALAVMLVVLKNLIFPIGVMISPVNFLILIFTILTPICLLIGFLFTMFVQISNNQSDSYVRIYALESIGSVIGGLVASFLFIQWFTIPQSFCVLLLIIAVSLFAIYRIKGYLVASIVVLVIIPITFLLPVENGLKSFLFMNQKVVESKETHYGNLVVTENSGQLNFYLNGSLQFTSDNTILNEETVHYAMLQRPNPESVLLISGGVSGMIEETLKYQTVKSVDYVEPNPQLVDMVQKYKQLPTDDRLKCFSEDGRGFVQSSTKLYDVAIFAIPEPSSLQANRYYTIEFLRILKNRLAKDAVVSFCLPPVGNYISPAKANIEASIYQTLKKCFANVEIITGEKDYMIASDGPINLHISELAKLGGISANYVNPYYIDDLSIQQRGEQIKQSISTQKEINTDNKPIPVFYSTLKFLSLFSLSNWMMFILPILLIVPFFFFPSASKGMYIAGFSASSVELLLIFIFQIIYGNIYSTIGLIIALFMGGLALGSWFARKFNKSEEWFGVSQILLGLSTLLLPAFWFIQQGFSPNLFTAIAFLTITVIPSAIVGFQFVVSTKLLSDNPVASAPITYAADLIGSALGVIAITVFLLPLIGLIYTCFAIAGLNLFVGMLKLSNVLRR